MDTGAGAYSLPRWRFTRWLADAGRDVPEDIRRTLVQSLYGTLPIFAGGVINTILVALVCTIRLGQPVFALWLGFEICVCLARFAVLVHAQRAARRGGRTFTDLYMTLALLWAAGVGFGTFISMQSGDWVVATLACLSAAAMVGGICFRNFGAPRLACAMIFVSLGPCCAGAALSGEPILWLVLFQIPFYLLSMGAASWKLNGILVSTIKAERDNDRRARHDELTGLSNRAGLARALEEKGLADSLGPKRLALLYLDLDGFKGVNDSLGHVAGDRLLCLVAERLRDMVPNGDVAARVGGDEFVVLAAAEDRAAVLRLGERLIAEIGGRPYELGKDLAVEIGVSVGIAFAPEHGRDFDGLIAAADKALYEAKSSGKSRCALADRAAAHEPAASDAMRAAASKPAAPIGKLRSAA
ncbi:GGDEF domain-containing protein [Enterovirga sp. DB1703]|uniref:GGDEF domain-containing protein n=1 Tax=Enterovirga aerilata TaxID=2730920 RepID=A0A849I650_9HYPH|nr:GGDEF domain-containing protein [Enterovirga sp. DB1703]